MLSANFKPKTTAAASRGFLATERLSGMILLSGVISVLIHRVSEKKTVPT